MNCKIRKSVDVCTRAPHFWRKGRLGGGGDHSEVEINHRTDSEQQFGLWSRDVGNKKKA